MAGVGARRWDGYGLKATTTKGNPHFSQRRREMGHPPKRVAVHLGLRIRPVEREILRYA